ncbi:hypothetical protein BCR44DRAFT_281052 [Catenaria anguillulae PL171]|uniref:Uncharacterized protein n=1 Tax=Catenaria anguillulae PL171 TaxID=765915 RepID=A0A1Y2HSF1_9FUNG|nr:hypothetical protein BCR44DRAFT_281052 [Catenaria anguillulae PL171]
MDRGSRTGNDSGGAASPGYQVLMIDVESTSDADQLSHYGSPCTDMCDDNQEGVVGFVAYRTQMPSWAPPATLRSGRRYNNSGPYSYLTVHIIDYPSLRPIATHSLVHRGFGSLQDECDLRAVARSATLPEHLWSLSMARKWSATLGHVDRENKLYSLICTDETRASLVHLRSFAQVDDASGKLVAGCTKASIYVASDHVASTGPQSTLFTTRPSTNPDSLSCSQCPVAYSSATSTRATWSPRSTCHAKRASRAKKLMAHCIARSSPNPERAQHQLNGWLTLSRTCTLPATKTTCGKPTSAPCKSKATCRRPCGHTCSTRLLHRPFSAGPCSALTCTLCFRQTASFRPWICDVRARMRDESGMWEPSLRAKSSKMWR